jgi:50S ribosomal subunit-associated GTPase HflX
MRISHSAIETFKQCPYKYKLNQIDKISAKELKILKKDAKQYKPIFVSAKNGEGLESLKMTLLQQKQSL